MWVLFLLMAVLAAILFTSLALLPSTRDLIFKVASLVPIALIVARLFYRALVPGELSGQLHLANVLQGLPLQMCGIAAIILPIIAFKKKQLLFSLVYFFSMPGTVITLALDASASLNFGDFEMWAFAVPHILYFLLPLAMIIFKFMRPKVSDLKWVLLIVAGFMTALHLINITINAIFGPLTVNFMFTVFPGDSVAQTGEFIEFPILGPLFHLVNDTQYFYLFLLLPLLAAIDALMCLPFIIKKHRYASSENTK